MSNVVLKYIGASTTQDTIVVKDFSFKWIIHTWGDGEVSITGKRRDDFRGYQAVLELNFEHDSQLDTVAKNIYDAIIAEEEIQYESSEGIIPVSIESVVSGNDYENQIRKKPSTLVLLGDIQNQRQFFITGILCGATDKYCGQTDILCGV